MYTIDGMDLCEFLDIAHTYPTDYLEARISEATELHLKLHTADPDLNADELDYLDDFIFNLSYLLDERERKTNGTLSKVKLHAYTTEYGFIQAGTKPFIFFSVEQCRAILERLYKDNMYLTDVELIGHHRYEGTFISSSIRDVIESL